MAASHIDSFVDESGKEVVDHEVSVTETEENGKIGSAVFLSAEELEKQGIDLETTDEILVRVEDGAILIKPVGGEE